MAVLDALPGLTVSVYVNGQPLPEFEDDTEKEPPDGLVAEYQASRTIWKYVEAVSDKGFSIRCPSMHRTKLIAPLLSSPAS
jgi:hypothetical protein